MRVLVQHLSQGVFTAQENGFGIDAHRHVPELFVRLVKGTWLVATHKHGSVVDQTEALATLT